MKIEIADNFLDPDQRSTIKIDNELSSFIENDEGNKIKADIELLNNMGFDKKMINKVYILLRPENIERALDYMTEINGLYQHNFMVGANPNEQTLCFICKKPRQNHMDYIPGDLLIGSQINITPTGNTKFIGEDLIEEKENKNDDINELIKGECEVCFEELNNEEKNLNTIPCGHLFCTHCWFNYLFTSITEAKVEKIKCMEHGCKEIVSEEFILKHISENDNLVEKYKKFKKRAEILNDKNKKICPNPDCDSFLQKSTSTKYVKCENGHEYCFDCLKPPHGDNSCDQKLETQFLKWKKGKRVKRCPRCQMFTEKNEGCNHMTCVSCNYQWCWLCEGEYEYSHYDSGKCKGQQFTRADNLKCICCKSFGFHNIFGPAYPELYGPVPFEDIPLIVKYLAIFGFLIFGYAVVAIFIMYNFISGDKVDFLDDCLENFFNFLTIIIVIALFISFQVCFTSFISVFILISFVYHPFFERVLLFFGIYEPF